jgi:hypothetical protein
VQGALSCERPDQPSKDAKEAPIWTDRPRRDRGLAGDHRGGPDCGSPSPEGEAAALLERSFPARLARHVEAFRRRFGCSPHPGDRERRLLAMLAGGRVAVTGRCAVCGDALPSLARSDARYCSLSVPGGRLPGPGPLSFAGRASCPKLRRAAYRPIQRIEASPPPQGRGPPRRLFSPTGISAFLRASVRLPPAEALSYGLNRGA